MDDNDADQKEIVLKCEDDINIDTEENEKDASSKLNDDFSIEENDDNSIDIELESEGEQPNLDWWNQVIIRTDGYPPNLTYIITLQIAGFLIFSQLFGFV